jgi:hypothetical protein
LPSFSLRRAVRKRRKFEQSIVDLNDATTFKLSGRGGAFLLRKRRRKKKKKKRQA